MFWLGWLGYRHFLEVGHYLGGEQLYRPHHLLMGQAGEPECAEYVVNPGGSGGALLDGEGRLIGLVSAIFTKRSDANIGVNFAASRALLMRVVEDLAAHGRVIRGASGLGVSDLDDAARGAIAGARVRRASSRSRWKPTNCGRAWWCARLRAVFPFG